MVLHQFKWIALLRLRQFAREVTCAVQLVSRLDRWVMGRNQDGWTTGRAANFASLVSNIAMEMAHSEIDVSL